MILIFDTETTGLPKNYNAPPSDSENWPRVVQIAWQLHDYDGALVQHASYIIRPEGFTIPFEAEKVHGISQERALAEGIPLADAMEKFEKAIIQATYFAGHNLDFDLSILAAEWFRLNKGEFPQRPTLDTKSDAVTEFCAIPGGKNGRYKWPTLGELYFKLFGTDFEKAHNAAFDIAANGRALFELIKMGIISVPECDKILLEQPIRYEFPDLSALKEEENRWERIKKEKYLSKKFDSSESNFTEANFPYFNTLHNHSQFSVLQSTTEIEEMVKKAADLESDAVAITDDGNMYGCFLFSQAVDKHNKKIEEFNKKKEDEGKPNEKKKILKAVFGTEIRVCRDHKNKTQKDDGYSIVLLAKNKTGYQNLSKLSSISLLEGFYYVPRIDKELLVKHKEGIIVLSGWLNGEIPSLILQHGEQEAEKSLQWYLNEFGEDFYLEIHKHGLPEEEAVNEVLLRFSKKYNIPFIAAHQNYYAEPEHHSVQDMLLCIRDGEKVSTPIGRGRGYRYGLPNKNFFFPTKKYIYEQFKNLPEAVINTQKLAEKIEAFSLNRDVLLPRFDIPQEFLVQHGLDIRSDEGFKKAENVYLRHLTYEGAKRRYREITPEIRERIDFELATIEKMGYPGYFLIVQDFTTKAREMGVLVGPGRGSAAGSVIAYCLGITNIDPMEYNLLFERFLNPDRISMPDIDIDFDDDGREKVLEYVVNKYGFNRVAQIITYGTLGGKSAIKDAARVLDYSLEDADRISKAFPQSNEAELKKLLHPDGLDSKYFDTIKDRPELVEQSQRFRNMAMQENPDGRLIRMAAQMEGCLRNLGVHACGVIITPGEITNYVPVTRAKDGNMMLTQFDNSVAESAGLLKMDFLGLKTLTIIRDALRFIEERHGIKIDIDKIPLDDKKTYQIFQKGQTNGIFQFESAGMQKYLKELKPDSLSDLIAMNALYRPGPLQYIPNFIRRKNGQEPISYPLPAMEEHLKETYGITVYQEQVMLLAQKLAGFSKGDADTLRKAMGKKQKDTLAKMKDKFMQGCMANGHPSDVCEKIWKDWEAFASYAFNKSHSTCYAYLAYQTAYLKANYTSEFMASVLNHQDKIEDITFFLEECQRLGLRVLGPDLNESESKFKVMDDGSIRFGLSAIKGVGENIVSLIVEEREKNGKYSGIFDFARRHDTKVINKKVLENLALAGCFDSFSNINRAMFFFADSEGKSNLTDILIKYCNQNMKGKTNLSQSLFADSDNSGHLPEPPIPNVNEWPMAEKLKKEKEVIGFYLSGHPLNPWNWIIRYFCNSSISEFKNNKEEFLNKEVQLVTMVESVQARTNKTGNPYLMASVTDKSGDVLELIITGKDFVKFQHFFVPDVKLLLKLKVVPSFDGKGTRINISEVELIEEFQKKIRKQVKIRTSLDSFTQNASNELMKIIQSFPGNNSFEITFYDQKSNREFHLTSQQLGVELSERFFQELEKLESCEIQLI